MMSMTMEPLMIDNATQIDLCGRVQQFMALQHYPSLRKLNVTVSGDTVFLEGCIPSFHERQMAVTFCKRVAGVHNVVDRLIVTDDRQAAGRGVRHHLNSGAGELPLAAGKYQQDAIKARRRLR